MDMHDRRESNLQEFNPDIQYNQEEQEDQEDQEEETIREERNPEIYEPDDKQLNAATDIQQEYLEEKVQEPVQTQSSIVNRLEYENVRVSFPQAIDSGINSYMVYKVKYTWQGKDFIVNRRFSDFISLRESLRKYLPCHYIFPVHKKKAIVIL